MSDQIPTKPTTIETIMASPLFKRGVIDARARRGFPAEYDTWNDKLWAYERGRQWAQAVPRNVMLKRDGRITLEAKKWFIKLDIL